MSYPTLLNHLQRGGGNEILVRMIGSALDSACPKPSHNSANDDQEKTPAAAFTEKRKQREYQCNANHRKARDIRNGDQGIKKSRVPAPLWEKKGMEKNDLKKTNSKKKMIGVDLDKKSTIISNDYNKVKGKKKVSTTFLEKKGKEKLPNASTGKNMQRDADAERRIMSNSHTKVKSKKVSTKLSEKEKNKERLNKTHREKKMQAADADSKMRNYESGVNKGKVSTTFFDKEKKRKRPSNHSIEKETTPTTSAVKEKKMRTTGSMEIKMRHDRHNRRNVPLDVSNDTSVVSNCKIRKTKLPPTLLEEKKRMRSNDSDKKIHSSRVKEMKIFSSGKEKTNQSPIAFLKFIRNHSENFLVIPPTVAPRLEYLTNQLVYLKDSEGKCSKVLVSKVDDSLAFHQGWDIFVSNHLIKWGEFLLFEYIAESTFSVRVFGTDSRERLKFNPESTNKGERKKQTWSDMSPDDLVVTDGNSQNIDDGCYVSGECPRTKVTQTCHVTCNTNKDPNKRVKCLVGSGPVAQDKNCNLIYLQSKTKGNSPLCSKGKTVIMITDSEPSADENEDTMKLATSGADSDTRHVAVNTNEDPKRAESGIGNEPSVVLAEEKGSFPDVECGTKCISTTCSEGKTRSQIIVTASALLDLHDSDEDLGRKQRTNAIPLGSITPVEKYHNHSEMNIIQNLCRKYEAPGGFRCLEKWRKVVVNTQATLDWTVLIKPEKSQRTDSALVDGYGSMELNPVDEYICAVGNHECVQPIFTMPLKEPSSSDRITNCEHDGIEINYRVNEKDGGVLETKGERLEGSIANRQSNNAHLCANPTVPGPIEETSSPDEISKCGSSMIEIRENVYGEGTTVQFETKMDQVEPVRSSVCNIVVRANGSEHHSSKQEGGMSNNSEVQESSLPVKDETLELDYHSPPEINLQLSIPDTTQQWLDLSKSLSSAVRQRRHHWTVIMLKDPMKRLWPIIYHENPIFVGFTAGWKHFVAANNLHTGDLCELIKETSEDDESVYSVRMCCKI